MTNASLLTRTCPLTLPHPGRLEGNVKRLIIASERTGQVQDYRKKGPVR